MNGGRVVTMGYLGLNVGKSGQLVAGGGVGTQGGGGYMGTIIAAIKLLYAEIYRKYQNT